MEEFSRIQRLPPYVFNITGEMKMAARRRGEDLDGDRRSEQPHAVGEQARAEKRDGCQRPHPVAEAPAELVDVIWLRPGIWPN